MEEFSPSQLLDQLVMQYYAHLDQQNSVMANQAFEQLVLRLTPVALAQIRKRLQEEYLLQQENELLNKLWVAIFQGATRPSQRWNAERGASFQTLSVSILNNKINDALRKRKNEREKGLVSLVIRNDEPSNHDLPDTDLNVLDQLIKNECVEVVKNAIKNLPKKYSLICWLKIIEKMKSVEISKVTGKTESFICKALAKSTIILKDFLGNSWDPQE